MAAIQPFWVIEDKKGVQSIVRIPIPSLTNATNSVAFVAAMGPILGALVNGRLVNAGVTISVTGVTGFPANATDDSDVQEKGYFSFRTLGGFVKSLNIPTIKETLFSPGTKFLDQSNAAVAAFITAMENGVAVGAHGGTGTISPSDDRDDGVSSILEARENWGKYRK